MNRRTLTALAVLGALTIVAVVVLRQPEKGERRGDRPRPIAQLKAGSFDTLTVTKDGATTTIRKDGENCKVVAPVQYPGDANVCKQAFEALEKLEFGDIVTEQKAKHAEFEVTDAGLKVAVKKGEQTVAEMLIGKSVGGNTLVRLPGKDEVWTGIGSFRYNFDRDATNWRDKTITKLEAGDAEQIEVKSKDGSRVVAKKGSGDSWSVAESSLKIEKLDSSVPTGIVSTLANWVTNEFADGTQPEQAGLATPSTTVTVSLKEGKTVTVMIGNKKAEDEYYVKTADKPQVFVVKKYNVDRLDKRPIDFRDKTICNISEGELGELSVTNGADSYTLVKGAKENDWKAAKPAGLTLDPTKVSPIATSFKDWKASGFAEDQNSKANGLAKPKATIVARSQDKKTSCTLKIGDETKDKVNYFAQAGAGPDVYLVPRWAADRVLTKVDDLKKK